MQFSCNNLCKKEFRYYIYYIYANRVSAKQAKKKFRLNFCLNEKCVCETSKKKFRLNFCLNEIFYFQINYKQILEFLLFKGTN